MSQLGDEFLADVAPDFEDEAGVLSTYERPGQFSVSGVPMLPPPSDLRDVASGGVLVPTTGGEFLCRKSLLVDGSNPVTPARGDKIVDAHGRAYDVVHCEDLAETGQWRLFVEKIG